MIGGANESRMTHQRVDATDRTERWAFGAFVAVEALALPFLVTIGRSIWFATDEWDFVAARTAWNVDDLFRPHNEHWSTLPILVYRLLWWIFGLRTHLPHQMIVVALHLTVAVLLRAVMRRAGIAPLTSTIGASAFALFGAGYFNIESAFQMAWCASLAFGLGYLLLVDHEGPPDRRDWLGLALGVAGLACSGPGVAMAIVVVIATFIRRGWRVACLHAIPLASVFLLWWALIGRSRYTRSATLGDAVWFMTTQLWRTFRSIGQLPGVGAALVALLIVGLVLAWGSRHAHDARRHAALPLALLIGAPCFMFITGIGRAAPVPLFRSQSSNVSRYLHVGAVMLLPALAFAADHVAKRWRRLAPAVAVVLAIGIPGNVRALVNETDKLVAQTRIDRTFILSVARNPIAKDLPRSLRPHTFAPDLTIGWLLDSVPSGRVPAPPTLTPTEVATQSLGLALRPAPTARPKRCRALRTPVVRVLRKAEALRVASGTVDVVYLSPEGGESNPRPLRDAAVVALAGPLRLRLDPSPTNANIPPILCD
jgi:hypothetical protein